MRSKLYTACERQQCYSALHFMQMGVLQYDHIVMSVPFEAELDDDAMATAAATAVCRSCALAAEVACVLSAVSTYHIRPALRSQHDSFLTFVASMHA